MAVRLLSFLIWGVVAATAVFWGVKLSVRPAPVPAHATTVATADAAAADLTRVFGADPPPAPNAAPAALAASSDRFKLVGIVAPRNPAAERDALAVIAVDGAPARAFRIGAAVDNDWVVQQVRPKQVALGPRGQAPALTLETLPPTAAATGTLPPATVTPGAVVPRSAPLPAPTRAPRMLPLPLPGTPPAQGSAASPAGDAPAPAGEPASGGSPMRGVGPAAS